MRLGCKGGGGGGVVDPPLHPIYNQSQFLADDNAESIHI